MFYINRVVALNQLLLLMLWPGCHGYLAPTAAQAYSTGRTSAISERIISPVQLVFGFLGFGFAKKIRLLLYQLSVIYSIHL